MNVRRTKIYNYFKDKNDRRKRLEKQLEKELNKHIIRKFKKRKCVYPYRKTFGMLI